MRKDAYKPLSRRSALLRMLAYLEQLHILMDIADGPDGVEDDKIAVDQTIDHMWTLGLSSGVSPHQHLDRYCNCHLALYQGEPESLWGSRGGW